MNNNKRSRGWCFTLNNYTEEDFVKFTKGEHINTLERWIVGKEIGESGTKHLQGYYYFKNARTLKKMKEVDGKAHWEAAKGSPKQNMDYCSKDGEYLSHNMNEEINIRKKTISDEFEEGTFRFAEEKRIFREEFAEEWKRAQEYIDHEYESEEEFDYGE